MVHKTGMLSESNLDHSADPEVESCELLAYAGAHPQPIPEVGLQHESEGSED